MSRATLHTIMGLLFVVSGATGLIYQVIWFKYLSLFLGNTTYAQTMVLAAFMGGLAIGAWLWGRRADSSRNPLAVYALLEIGIGLYCFLYPPIMDLSRGLLVGLVRGGGYPSDGSVVLLLKLFLSLCTLLVPTILMGGTLPVLVRSLSSSVEESGKNVSILYFLNSFGAVIGAALGGFFLVPAIGLSGSLEGAAAVNVLLGLVVIVLSRFGLKSRGTLSGEPPVQAPAFSDRQIFAALTTAGVSGLAAMIYEVCWVRLLLPVLGSSTYSFTVMLMAFISGITIGSLIVSMLVGRAKNLFGLLSACQIGITVSMIATLPLYGRLPYEFWRLASILHRSEQTYAVYLSLEFFFCFLVVMIPTVFMGMTLPIASRIATRSVAVMGRSVGDVFSINTVGTVIGSLLCGLVLIPAIGVRHALELGLAANLLMAGGLWFVDPLVKARGRAGRLAVALGLTLLYFWMAPNWSQSVMLSGVFRNINKSAPPPRDFASFAGEFATARKLYYREGRSATVAVVEEGRGPAQQLILVVNGKPDASSRGDLPSQTLVGQLPMMLHRRPDSALVIGLGSGVSLGSVLTHTVRRVDCAEISPEVVEASHCFDGMNNRPLEDPRTHLFIDDALSFLKLTGSRYDVIASEPTNPWIAGVGNLYTSEFFLQCRDHLKDGGVMVQWFHLYEMDDRILRTVLRTFRRVFPHVSIWQSADSDIIMVGSAQPLIIDPGALERRFMEDRVRRDFLKIGIGDLPTLLSTQLSTDDQLDRYAGTGELNSENRPLVEYEAPRAFFVNRGATDLMKYDERMTFARHPLLLSRYVEHTPLTDNDRLAIARLHLSPWRGNLAFGYAMAAQYLEHNPDNAAVLISAAKAADRLGLREQAMQYRARIMKLNPTDASNLAGYAWSQYLDEQKVSGVFTPADFAGIETLLTRAIQAAEDTADTYRIMLGDVYLHSQRFAQAADCFRRALVLRQMYESMSTVSQSALLLRLSEAMHGMNREDQAKAFAAQAALADMENESAKAYLDYLLAGDTTALRLQWDGNR